MLKLESHVLKVKWRNDGTLTKIMLKGSKLVLRSLQLILETIYGGGCHLPAKYVRTAESHGTRQQRIHPSKICFYVKKNFSCRYSEKDKYDMLGFYEEMSCFRIS